MNKGHAEKLVNPGYEALLAQAELNDHRIAELERLVGENPSGVKTCLALFNEGGIKRIREKVIGVRSEDVVSFLLGYLGGAVDVSSHPGEVRPMSKGEMNGLFITPINSDWADTTFYEKILQNNLNLYARKLPFNIAFVQTLIPLFKRNWVEQGKNILSHYGYPDAAIYGKDKVIEGLGDELLRELDIIRGTALIESAVKQRNRHPFIFGLAELLDTNEISLKIKTMRLMKRISEERGGLLVGFGHNLLEVCDLRSDGDKNPLLEYEATAIPKDGTMSVSYPQVVVGLETLGEYEDEIITRINKWL